MTSSQKHQHPELTNSLLWVLAIATGMIVANLYYNQPLLNAIAITFHVSSKKVAQVSVLTQIGYAAGMLFIAPMADMRERKKLILVCLAIDVASLLIAATASSINILIFASFLVGVFSLIPQLLVPMAAHLAKPHERGKKIGFVMSGLLIGILLARTVSGLVGKFFGWQTMFFIATGLMVIIWLVLFFMLPKVQPEYKGKYGSLMSSMITLIKEEPALRIASLRGALCFACFMAFWSTLVFLLRDSFHYDEGQASAITGYFGLVGIVGALAAGIMGRLSDRMDAYKLSTFTLLLIILSFVIFFFSAQSTIGLVIGVIIMDMGVQATHISNQSLIYSLKAEARNRINTVYIVTYFIGGSLGTYITSLAWSYYKWTGVCVTGALLSTIAILVHLANQKTIHRARHGV